MKNQAKKKLTFNKNSVLELNDSKLYKIRAGSVSLMIGDYQNGSDNSNNDPNGTGRLCMTTLPNDTTANNNANDHHHVISG